MLVDVGSMTCPGTDVYEGPSALCPLEHEHNWDHMQDQGDRLCQIIGVSQLWLEAFLFGVYIAIFCIHLFCTVLVMSARQREDCNEYAYDRYPEREKELDRCR